MSKQVILTIPDSVDLSALREMMVILHYYKDGNDLYEYSTDMFSLSETKRDLISRETVKKNIDKFIGYLDEDMIYRIKVAIDKVPTIESERPKGKWIKDEEHSITIEMFKCSICGFWNDAEHFRFCPNCGARMVGDEE